MKKTEPYPISFRSLRERWRDGDRRLNDGTWLLLIIVVLLVAKLCFDFPAFPTGTSGILGAVVASTLLRAPSRMPLPDAKGRETVADWLVRNGYRQDGPDWVPDLPRILRRRSQAVRVTDGDVIGPRHALKMMQRRWMASSPGSS